MPAPSWASTLYPKLTAYLSLGSFIVFFGACAGHPVVVHVGVSESAQAVARHHEGLRSARAGLSIVGLQHLAPDVLSFASDGPYRILMQSRLPGTASHLCYAGELELYNAIDHALLPLLHLRVEAAVTKSSTGAAAICGCGGVKSSQW